MADYSKMELAWPGGDLPGNKYCYEVPHSIYDNLVVIFFKLKNSNICKFFSAVPKYDNSICGRYFIFTPDQSFFMRISRRTGHPLLEKQVIDHLFFDGVSVNPVLRSEIIDFKGSFIRVDLRPYLEPSFFDYSIEDIWLVGLELKKLHESIDSFPLKDVIFNNTQSRYDDLDRVSQLILNDGFSSFFELKSHRDWIEKNSLETGKIISFFDPYIFNKDGACVLHGEVHPANILFDRKNKRAVFIDFEESVHTFAPVSWDLAYFVLRFIFADEPDMALAERRIVALERSYGKTGQDLFDYMVKSVSFSIVTAFSLIKDKIAVPVVELDKFLNLYKKIEFYRRGLQ